jgi:hypothetical protein
MLQLTLGDRFGWSYRFEVSQDPLVRKLSRPVVLMTFGVFHQDVDIKGGPRLLESDTTVAGNTLLDPIETPAGKRQLTSSIR